MTKAIPTLGYPSRSEAINSLHEQGKTKEEIGELIGIPPWNVQVFIARGRAATRPNRKQVQLPAEIADSFHRAAWDRGISSTRLIARILEIIAKDNMIEAILDDKNDEN